MGIELVKLNPPAEAVDTRRSFMDAVTDLCQNCHLAQLENPAEWPDAANADIAAANTLFRFLAEDLTAITGVKCHPPVFTDVLDTAGYQSYKTVEDRVAGLKAAFVQAVQDRVRQALKAMRENYIADDRSRVVKRERLGRSEYNVYAKTIYPLTPVDFFQDVAMFKFPHGKGQERKVYEFGLSTWAMVAPDDHNMSIPIRTMQKLEVLKTTHFNYHPKVLRGVLVRKSEVEMNKREFFRTFNPDPALVVHLGWQMAFVCDYWEDPAANEDIPASLIVARRAKYDWFGSFFLYAAVITLGVVLATAFYWSSWRWWWDAISTFFGLIFTAVGCACTYDEVVLAIYGQVPIEDPVKTHELTL